MNFKVAAIFSNSMVLQRQKPILVFGEAENDKSVIVSMLGKKAITTAKDGKWCVKLPPFEAQEDVAMTVECDGEVKTFTDIAIGEVWLAGGQSNMELELQNSKNGREVLASVKDVNVRFYYTQKKPVMDEQFFKDEANTAWSRFSPNTAACWSAVGYYFAKMLSEKLSCTVGIVGCNWGGTTASNWVSEETLASDSDLSSYLADFEKAKAGKSDEQLIDELAEYRIFCAEWDKKVAKCYQEDPKMSWDEVQRRCGQCQYPGPLGPTHEFRPNGLYHTMIKRVCPYTMRGFLYYQGESDDHKPAMYAKLLTALIRNWRTDWGDMDMPFEIVQLPMFKNEADPDWKHWAKIREQQERVYRTVKNTQLAVILDCGEFNNIHPIEKEPVGERLCRLALEHTYSMRCNADAPMLDYSYTEGNKLYAVLKNCKNITLQGEQSDFEIAGEDKQFVPCSVELSGNKVIFSADGIENPRYARYAFVNWGIPCLYGDNSLPCAPFRTSQDDE